MITSVEQRALTAELAVPAKMIRLKDYLGPCQMHERPQGTVAGWYCWPSSPEGDSLTSDLHLIFSLLSSWASGKRLVPGGFGDL